MKTNIKWLMLVCLLIAGLVVVGCAPGKAPKPGAPKAPAGYESIRLVGSTLGSEASVAAMAYAAIFNRYYPDIEWSSSSGAAATNPVYLSKGTVKMAYTVATAYVDAYGFDKVPESRLRSINIPRPHSHYVFFIPEDKPWTDITQVPRGVNLSPGGPGTTIPIACEAWLKAAGLSKKDFNWLPLSKTEVTDHWKAGKLDLFFQSIAGGAPWITEIQMSPRKVRLMGITPEQVAKAKAEQVFERVGFPPPAMSELVRVMPEIFKYDVVCVQQPGFYCVRDDFPEEIAYRMAKIIDERYAELVQIYPGMKYGLTPQWHIQWAKPPCDIHPGVARYYKEKGYLK